MSDYNKIMIEQLRKYNEDLRIENEKLKLEKEMTDNQINVLLDKVIKLNQKLIDSGIK